MNESKFFAEEPEGASSYAKQAFCAYDGEPEYFIVSVDAPCKIGDKKEVDSGIATLILNDEELQLLGTPAVLDRCPFPPVPDKGYPPIRSDYPSS